MIEVWYRVHVVGIGWSGFRVGLAISEMCKAVEKGKSDIQERIEEIARSCEAVAKALRPEIKSIKEISLRSFDYYSPPEEKKIYRAEYRMKSNVKNYGHMPNYRGRMFCVGDRGNYRRF